MKTEIHFPSYLACLFLKLKTFHINLKRKLTHTHILCSKSFSFNRAVYEIKRKKILERGKATDGNMAHARSMLDT